MANMLEVYGSHYLCTGLILCAIIIAYLCSSLLRGAPLGPFVNGAAAHKINLNSRTDRADTLSAKMHNLVNSIFLHVSRLVLCFVFASFVACFNVEIWRIRAVLPFAAYLS